MRSRSIALGLFIFAFISIIAGVAYRAAKISTDLPTPVESNVNSSPQDSALATASPVPAASGMPSQPTESGVPVANSAPVPHPSPRVLDLTPDARGASKFHVRLTTSKGAIRLKLYPKQAPKTVARFVELIQKGFYSGLKFHKVVPDFLIQTGDPQGTGMGGSGVKLRAEINDLRHNAGMVGMARGSDPNSADSQFYITLTSQPQLDHSYTLFAEVVEGLEVARKIEKNDTLTDVQITD